jgi:hydroxymethylglutaryl-CoA reductase
MKGKGSRISGFYRLSIKERVEFVKEFSSLSGEEASLLHQSLDLSTADRFIENVIGTYQLPLGIAVNFLINGRDYLIPMAIEESSVVAAASNAAKLARVKGGFQASATEPLMIGQIQLKGIKSIEKAKRDLLASKREILGLANAQDPFLRKLGGGARDLEVRKIETGRGDMLIVHLLVDVKDAMGANIVNTMAEAVAPLIQTITKGEVGLRIISNLADRRIATSRTVFDEEAIGGVKVVDGILDAYEFAKADPYRAATHNKGIMNGIDPIVIATGNDFRAVEAGAHSYAVQLNGYKPLTRWWKDKDGNLQGEIKLPLALGTVGGLTKLHPCAKLCLKILGVKSAQELAEVIASVGLAQNFGALRALATEGIQRGHMKLHAKNIAMMAGAKGELVDKIAEQMIEKGKINIDLAKELLKELKK